MANCLDILDSFLLGRWATVEEQSQIYHDLINGNRQEDLAEGLATLCAVCNIILRNGEFEDIIPIGNKFRPVSLILLTSISFQLTVVSSLRFGYLLISPTQIRPGARF
jgi:hypothetical protein